MGSDIKKSRDLVWKQIDFGNIIQRPILYAAVDFESYKVVYIGLGHIVCIMPTAGNAQIQLYGSTACFYATHYFDPMDIPLPSSPPTK